MNLLAKHFFDYQSFVNLPHKAVQLHKTPPSQAGVDPSAAWAPKSMHLAGKNQAAPAARANRNRVEPRTGGHQHGRPNKLEFRSWGDRHGELHAEKIVPHKDEWMMNLSGEFKHFYEHDEGFGSDGVESAIQHFPTFSQRCVEVGDLEVLTILTLAAHSDVITVTVKAIRGLSHLKNRPFIRVQLLDGGQLIGERPARRQQQPHINTSESLLKSDNRASAPHLHRVADHVSATTTFSPPPAPPTSSLLRTTTASRRRLSRAAGCIAEAQVPRALQPFRNKFQTQSFRRGGDVGAPGRPAGRLPQHFYSMASLRRYQSHAEPIYRIVVPPPGELFATGHPIRVQLNHNGCPPSAQRQPRQSLLERGDSLGDWPTRRSSSPPLSNSTTTVADNCSAYGDNLIGRWDDSRRQAPTMLTDTDNEAVTDIGDSFMMRVPRSSLSQCHLLVQIFSCGQSAMPPPPPSSLNLPEAGSVIPQRASSEFLNDDTTPNSPAATRRASQQLAEVLVAECLCRAIDELTCAVGQADFAITTRNGLGAFQIDDIHRMIDQSSDSNDGIGAEGTSQRNDVAVGSGIDTARKISALDRRSIETPPQFLSSSSKDSFESSADSMLEELDGGPSSALLHYSECCEEEDDEEFSSVASAATAPLPQRRVASGAGEMPSLVGGFVIGPLGSSRGRWHWRHMAQRQGHPVFMWHRVVRPEKNG